MKIQPLAILISIASLSFCSLVFADDLSGYWETADKLAIIKMQANGDRFDGSIAALKEPRYPVSDGPQWEGKMRVDRNNPDPNLRTVTLVGLTILRGLRPDGPNRWTDGHVYNPDDGHVYQCKAWMSADETKLKVHGFLGVSLLGETVQWTRIDSAVFPDAAH